GRLIPTRFIVTTPNMTYIPDFSKDEASVRLRLDGRYYTGDFTQWPQWYHSATPYLPSVQARPSRKALKTHPYALAWRNITKVDFDFEEGSAFRDFGRIKQELANSVMDMRRDLGKQVDEYVGRNPHKCTAAERRDLCHCARGMAFAAIALNCASQTFDDTVLTFTSFQRYYLETLAIFEYYSIHRPYSVSVPLDSQNLERQDGLAMVGVVGAVTCDLWVAQELYSLSVPVWLVRPPSRIPRNMIIINPDGQLEPPLDLVAERWEGYEPAYTGPASAVRNCASQNLQADNIRIGHSAIGTFLVLFSFILAY
ncbi:hypothetical protein GALMADRAFT_81854, partial [Galerina marginata CBS 339.88]